METLYDVQQLFKQFGMYIYVGARIYDIELMMIELRSIGRPRYVFTGPAYFAKRASNRRI